MSEQFLSQYSVYLLHKSSCDHPLLNGYCSYFRRVLADMLCVYTVYLTDSSLWGVLFFQGSTCSHTFQWYRNYFMRPLTVSYFFHWYCASIDQALAVIPYFKGSELIRRSSWSHPFDGWPFFYYKRSVTATHYFKFTVL